MMKPSDNNVENWIEEIHREHYDSFLRYAQVCFRIFGRGVVHRAEDAVQLTYEKVWMKKEELLTKDDPIAWFYAVLKNTVRELSRDDMRWQMHMNQIVVLMVTTGGTEFVLRAELKSMMIHVGDARQPHKEGSWKKMQNKKNFLKKNVNKCHPKVTYEVEEVLGNDIKS